MTTTITTTDTADTTVDAPLCPECGGAGGFTWAAGGGEMEGEQCYACNATGYQRGDDASLLASVPPEEDDEPVTWGALMVAGRSEIVRSSGYEFLGRTPTV